MSDEQKPETKQLTWEDHEKLETIRTGGEFVLKGGGAVEKTVLPEPKPKEGEVSNVS